MSQVKGNNIINILVLVVEDSRHSFRLVQLLFDEAIVANMQFTLEQVGTLDRALARLKSNGIDLILLDLYLPDSSGMNTFDKIYAASAGIPIVVLTSADDNDLAVDMVRKGAEDFLTKGTVSSQSLVRVVRLAVERTARNARHSASR